ncbi:MAG: dephospho-CoA kinase [Leptospiraceae bacterium]|nr:dephospho-CoA kinase [Leptospiraceae bacterium]
MKVWKEKFVLGITGIIGSGKSTVSRIFEEFGAIRISTDELAKVYTTKESPVLEKIKELVDENIFTGDGEVDRKKIASIVFKDKGKLDKLNSLIHPLVFQKSKEMFENIQGGIVIAWEVPLLFESGADKMCDATLTVSLDPSLCFDRVQRREDMSLEEYNDRLNNQMSLETKLSLSNFFIINDKNIPALKDSCRDVLKQIHQYKGQ